MRFQRPADQGGGIGVTSYLQAHAYIAAGIAEWDHEGLLVFLPTDRRCIAAATSRARRRLVNGDGFASLEAIAGLPCIQPIRLLAGKRPSSPPVDYPQPVELSRSPSPAPAFAVPEWPLPRAE